MTEEETRLFEKCRQENLRLEQEKIPQAWVEEWMARTGAS
ncbi:MAG: hypothetical protein HKN82_15225 [Akkermansiaceae bacterium]|nr:hypothetical protein [Akkermansiaceae bacterium]NNM28603.1 hypothetical protein [Akkermansiaceae bacterium]